MTLTVELRKMGERIRKQRTYLGLTREKFSEKIGITPKFCADIELGKKGMSIQTLCKITQILHLSADYILFGVEHKPETASITHMLQLFPQEYLGYAEKMLQVFLLAVSEANS